MFNAFSVEENCFVSNNYIKNIQYIMPSTELMVNFRSNGMKTKKTCLIYAEKMDFKGIIQLRIAEKCDQRKMYITTVDVNSFQELKQEQSLHVTFSGFVENLVHILQDCQAGKLELCLVECCATSDTRMNESASNSGALREFQLHFVEVRSFKNLTHLCLPCHMAPLNVVLFYMNSAMDSLQKKYVNQEQTIQQLQQEISSHLRRIDDLDRECVNLRQDNLEAIRSLNQKHAEEVLQLQESLRKIAEQRHHDSDRHRQGVVSLQGQLEKLKTENVNLQTEKLREQKCNDTLTEELRELKDRFANLKEQNEKLNAEISALKNTERKVEMHFQDTRKELSDCKEKLKKYDKNKADLVAELEAEKKISQTKRRALEMATEEISKANEIIMKQSQELVKLKKTVNWRTEVALKQEQIVRQKDIILKDNDLEIAFLKETIDTLRKEIPKELDSLRQFAKTLELKYSKQIEALKCKMHSSNKENLSPNCRKNDGRKH